MRNRKEEIITLSRRPFKEKDRLVTALGRYSGRLSLLTRGAQKPGAKLAGVSEPFTYANVMIAAPRNISVVASADIRESFPAMRSNLASIGAAYHIAGLAARASAPQLPPEELFFNLLSCLYILESKADPTLVKRFFELRLSAWAGYELNYTHCPCGKPLSEAVYSPLRGCFLCSRCYGGTHSMGFPFALLSYIKALDTTPENRIRLLSFPEAVLYDLQRLLETHLTTHMELSPHDFRTANSLESSD